MVRQFSLSLFAATVLTGYAFQAQAANILAFTTNDPNSKQSFTQLGDYNAITGNVVGSGNTFTVQQVGYFNQTDITSGAGMMGIRNLSNSVIISSSIGNNNKVFIKAGYGDSANRISVSARGDANTVRSDVVATSGNTNNTTIVGSSNNVSNYVGNFSAGGLPMLSNNISDVNVSGNRNTVSQSVNGPLNSAVYTTISGDSNVVNNHALGQDNRAWYTIYGSNNTVKGIDSATASQSGSGNVLSAYIPKGNFNTLSLTQRNSYANGMYAYINGDYNRISLSQTGAYNIIFPAIAGYNNSITASQNGNNNNMQIGFNGVNNHGTFTQTGNGKTLNFSYTGSNKTISIAQ